MEESRAAADRGGDKSTNMGLDWPDTEETRRPRGPLSGTGRGNGMSELEERGLTWCGAKATVRNRVRWRALVEDLCSIRNE